MIKELLKFLNCSSTVLEAVLVFKDYPIFEIGKEIFLSYLNKILSYFFSLRT